MNKKNKSQIPKPILILIGIIILVNIVPIIIFTFQHNFCTSIEILRNFYIWLLGSQPLTSIAILTTVATAFMSYKKYSFEKNRDLYIQKLQKVYAPLYSYVIKQETSRRIFWLKSKDSKESYTFENAPIFKIYRKPFKLKLTLKNNKFTLENNDLKPKDNNSTLNITSILDWKQIWKIIDKEDNYSFMSTNLIHLISIKSMLDDLCKEDPTDDTDKKLLKFQKETEVKIIKDICEEYKKCIQKLGLDDNVEVIDLQKFSLGELEK